MLVSSPEGYRRTSLVKEPALGSQGVELVHPGCSPSELDEHPAPADVTVT